MKVAFTADGVFPAAMGGMARHTSFLVRHLARPGADVEVFHPGPERCFVDQHVTETLVPWPHYRFRGHYVAESRVFATRVSRAIAAHGPFDVGYVQGLSSWGWTGKLEFPCLVNPHGLEFLQMDGVADRLSSLPVRMAFRSVLKQADRVVSLGGSLTGLLADEFDIPPSRLAIIPNGVDLDYVDEHRTDSRMGSEKKMFLFVGRLAFNKGLPELVTAFNAIERTDVELVIVGEGEMRKTLEQVISNPAIRLAGRVDDDELFKLLRSASCFVFPTRGEGMPTAILEAMACGLPVIATRVGAIPELVDDSNGTLIDSGDPAAIRDAVKWMAALQPHERASMGSTSRARVEDRFTWPRVADETVAVLEEMVGEFRSG